MGQLRIAAVLLRFQLHAGARVALRTLAPAAAGVAAASVMYGSPMVVIEFARGLLFPREASIGAAVFATAMGVLVAMSSAPRLIPGFVGWARHLPASGIAYRRAATAGLAVVQLPLLVIAATAGLAALPDQPSITSIRLAAMVPLAWATSLAAVPVKKGPTRAVAIAAAGVAWYGTWTGLAVGLSLALAAELAAGEIASGGRVRTRRWTLKRSKEPAEPGPPIVAASRMWWKIARRALGWRVITGAASGLLVVVPLLFFLRNNVLTPVQHAIALRLAATAAVLAPMAVVADGLVKTRPPWPWIRSLPWSACTRVSLDGAVLALVSMPVFLFAAVLDLGTVWVVAGVLPMLGVRGAAAIRQAPGRLSGASGQLLIEGSLAAVAVSLVPWASLVFLVLTPLAARHAAELERSAEISRWHELHHLAAGDPLSWSDA